MITNEHYSTIGERPAGRITDFGDNRTSVDWSTIETSTGSLENLRSAHIAGAEIDAMRSAFQLTDGKPPQGRRKGRAIGAIHPSADMQRPAMIKPHSFKPILNKCGYPWPWFHGEAM